MINKKMYLQIGQGCIFLFMMLLYWNRLSVGTALSDEGYYYATAYDFFKGNIPFVDSWGVHQGAAILTVPLLRLYYDLYGSFDGLILFMRRAYFVVTMICCIFMVKQLETKMSRQNALYIIFPLFFWTAFWRMSFDYNTYSVWLITLGCVLLFSASGKRQQTVKFIFAGGLHALSVLVYPSLVFFCFMQALVLFWLAYSKRIDYRESMGYFFGGIAVALFIFGGLVHRTAGLKNLLQGIEYMLCSDYNKTAIWNQTGMLWKVIFKPTVIAGGGALACVGFFHWKRGYTSALEGAIKYVVCASCGIAMLSLVLFKYMQQPWRNEYIPFVFAIVLLYGAYLFSLEVRKDWALLYFMVVPAILLTFTRTLTSDIGNTFMQILVVPLYLMAASYAFHLMCLGRFHGGLVGIQSIVLSFLMLYGLMTYAYDEEPVRELNVPIRGGVLSEIRTSEARAQGVEKIGFELREHIPPNNNVLVLGPVFPLAYIMSDAVPCTPDLWSSFLSYNRLRSYFVERRRVPDFIVFVLSKERTHGDGQLVVTDEQMRDFLEENYELIHQAASDGQYVDYIYRLKKHIEKESILNSL